MFRIGDLVTPRRDALGRAFINPDGSTATPANWDYTKRGDLYVCIGQLTLSHGISDKFISMLWSAKDFKIVHLYENEIEAC